MLKNQKILSNNGKIMKGVHLESFIFYDNTVTGIMTVGMSGASTEKPLYLYMYDNTSYTFYPITQDSTTNLSLSNGSAEDKYVITYGNNDALTYVNFNYYYIDGDFKGFVNNYTNLETIILQRSRFIQNMDNFKWPKSLTTLKISTSTTLTGNFNTFENLENLEILELITDGFTGDITKLVNLKELFLNNSNISGEISALENLTNITLNSADITGTINDWGFIPNLTYFYLGSCNVLEGSISNIPFNPDISYIYLYRNNKLSGDMSNWDFSNHNSGVTITYFRLDNYGGTNDITGNLSGWTFADNMIISNIYWRYLQITNLELDFSNISVPSITLSSLTTLTSSINDIILSDTTTTFSVNTTSMSGDISTFYFPPSLTSLSLSSNPSMGGDIISIPIDNISGITYFGCTNCSFIGDVSGITLWEGLNTYSLTNNNLTGSFSGANTTIPDSLNNIYLDNNDIILDLSSELDMKNVTYFYFDTISGITGDFSNLIIDKVIRFSINYNTFDIDMGNLVLNWSVIKRIYSDNLTTNGNSDLTDWFPSGETTNLEYLYLYDSDFVADITNWYFDTWTYGSSNLGIYNCPNVTGDISGWQCYLPATFNIGNTGIAGDIGQMDFTSKPCRSIGMSDCNVYGNLSGLTLDYSFYSLNLTNSSGVTGSDYLMTYMWDNRKLWTYNFSIYISNIGDNPSGTYELGSLGTYTGHAWDLTEAEINNLVLGNDYDGGGSNTPWDVLQKYYYHKNAKDGELSTVQKYKINYITYI